MPALARCAAMAAPMVPAPMTAARRISSGAAGAVASEAGMEVGPGEGILV